MPLAEELAEDGLRLATPLTWHVTVQSTGGDDDYFVDGSVHGSVVMECRRCLEDVEVPVQADFVYELLYHAGKVEALTLLESPLDGGGIDEDVALAEDHLVFGRPVVDFAPLLRQVFAIEQPLTVVCDEACRGLSIDGVNLNEHPDHVPRGGHPLGADAAAASPFAVLADLDVESSS